MSAKDKNAEVFSYFTSVRCEIRARSHTISFNKGFWTRLGICDNANVCKL